MWLGCVYCYILAIQVVTHASPDYDEDKFVSDY